MKSGQWHLITQHWSLIAQVLGSGHELEEFYWQPAVMQAYKTYMNAIILRKNTRTGAFMTSKYSNIRTIVSNHCLTLNLAGVMYRDDPVILAWELANEPQTRDNYERTLGTTPGLLVSVLFILFY
jgi:hypothetical protein